MGMERQDADGPCVWVAKPIVTSELGFGFTCQLAEDDNALLVARIGAFQRGEAMSAGDLPSSMWISPRFRGDDRRKLPHLFVAGGLVTVSEAFAGALADFPLGRTRLHPVELWRLNRKERFPGSYYFLNVTEVHRFFSPEHSARWEPFKNSRSTYLGAPCPDTQDDDLTVIPGALNGPAIWVDDTLSSTVFFSDPLVRALRAAKLTGRLRFFRCRVATAH